MESTSADGQYSAWTSPAAAGSAWTTSPGPATSSGSTMVLTTSATM